MKGIRVCTGFCVGSSKPLGSILVLLALSAGLEVERVYTTRFDTYVSLNEVSLGLKFTGVANLKQELLQLSCLSWLVSRPERES